MTAPALVALAHGSRDRRSGQTVREIMVATEHAQPGLAVETAFLEHDGPGLQVVVDRLSADGHREIVVVPLFLTSAYHVLVDVPAAVERARARHLTMGIRLAGPVGSDSSLLRVVDQRLREAPGLQKREPEALVLASAGSTSSAANDTISRLAQLWGSRRHLPTSVAFASAASPSTGEAVREWHRQGYRDVAVGSLFIAPGKLADHTAERALEAGAVAVSAALGAHPELSRLILARYWLAAQHGVAAEPDLARHRQRPRQRPRQVA